VCVVEAKGQLSSLVHQQMHDGVNEDCTFFISFSFCCVASFTSTRLIDYTMNFINNASKLEGRIARACE
jgi:hypothetical protein